MLEVRPAHAGGEAQVGQPGLRVRAQPAAVLIGQPQQRGRCPRGERKNAEPRATGGLGAVGARHRRRFFEDDVRVGSGEPERADPGDAGPLVALPGGGLLHDLQREPVPGDVR